MPKLAGHTYAWVPAGNPEAPTVLLLHGTGADERDLLPLGELVAGGGALLSPRGLVNEQGSNRWFRRLAEGVFDTDDLVRRAGELATFIDAAAEAHGFDPDSVVAVGFSNGANMAAGLLLLHPGLLRGAALLSAMLPLRPGALPDLSGIDVLVSGGRSDPLAPPESARALAQLLNEAGAQVREHWHDHGHGIDRAQVELTAAWLAALRASPGDAGNAVR